MNVILRSDVKGLGKRGDVVAVADGHARNYLLPHGLAIGASDGAIAQAAAMRKARDNKERASREAAQEVAGRLGSATISLQPRRAMKAASSARSPQPRLPRPSPPKPASKSTSATSLSTAPSVRLAATRWSLACTTTSPARLLSTSLPAELFTFIHRPSTGLSPRTAPSDPQGR